MKTETLTPEMKASNSLIYKTNKIVGKEHIFVKISLDDDCKNGHQDFAITADIYQAGKAKIDKYWIGGGCCHDDILKAFPEFKIFVNLHLCDYTGAPMYAVDNGMYFLRNGFNNTKPEDKNFAAEYCEYYRLTMEQFMELSTSRNKIEFALKLRDLGILEQWQQEANKAILMLEEMTNTKFVNDSKKNQLGFPKDEEIKEEQEKVKNGYYTPEAIAAREQEAINKILSKLEAERDADILNATNEFEVKKQVLLTGGKKALDNCIFYSHTQTIAFNWRGYDRISTELIEKIKAEIKLPEGVKIEEKERS